MLKAGGIMTVSPSGRGSPQAVRVGVMHAIKGLEFQAVAVIGVEQGLVPEPGGGHSGRRGSRRACPGPAAGTLRPVRGLHPRPGPSLRIRHRRAEHIPAASRSGSSTVQ